MKNLLLLTAFFAISSLSHAQHYTSQNKVWVFGGHAGVNFASGTPVAISSGINTVFGSASVASASGSLLFYSDGTKVFNRTHAIMPHGTAIVPFGTISTQQAALILPAIGLANKYYLFSLESFYPGFPLRSKLAYSIVDMTLDGGNGDVDSTAMGIPLAANLSEKMTAVAGDACDAWLLVHSRDSALFFAYHITAAGIDTTPVRSYTGALVGPDAHTRGAIKASPNRHKIVLTQTNFLPIDTVGVELFDFNPATGIVSNGKVLDTGGCQSAEFSPDNTKLYAQPARPTPVLVQFDITLPTAAAIAASDSVISTLTFGNDLRLGPDNKLYVQNQYHLGCIQYPNLRGVACNYTMAAIPLSITVGSMGLPNIVVSELPGCSTKVEETVRANDVTIFPNPTTGDLIIRTAPAEYEELCITGSTGVAVMHISITLEQTTVDTRSLPAGLYYLALKGKAGLTMRWFVKK